MRMRRLAPLALLVALMLPAACGDGDSTTGSSSAPTVVACNSVSYKGTTYTNLGCAPGIASFQVTITQSGQTACFSVTCSAGCVSSARVC